MKVTVQTGTHMSIRYVAFSDLLETGGDFVAMAFQCWFTVGYSGGQNRVV